MIALAEENQKTIITLDALVLGVAMASAAIPLTLRDEIRTGAVITRSNILLYYIQPSAMTEAELKADFELTKYTP